MDGVHGVFLVGVGGDSYTEAGLEEKLLVGPIL